MKTYECPICGLEFEDDNPRFITCSNCGEEFDLCDEEEKDWNHDIKESQNF